MSSLRNFALDLVDFGQKSGFDFLGSPLTKRDPANVREIAIEGFCHSGVQSPIKQSPSKQLPVILKGQFLACHNSSVITPALRPVKEIMTTGARLAKPEWVNRIAALRSKLALSGSAFAQRLGVSAMAVSRWERGINEPAAEIYIKMGQMASPEEGLFFFERAGLSASDLRIATQDKGGSVVHIEVQPARGSTIEGTKLKRKPDAVAVPLLRDAAAAGSPRMIAQGAVEDILIIRRKECPHPEETVAIYIAGESMSPILEDGYTVVIDTHQEDRRSLYNKMVAARDPEGGVTVKWLRKVGREEVLVAQHTSPRYQPVILSSDPNWRIIGRVLFWIGRPS